MLDALLGLPAGMFERVHFPNRPCVAHGELARVPGRELASVDVTTLLARYAAPTLLAYQPASASQLPRDAALARFASGTTIELGHLDSHIPELADWLAAARRHLGLPARGSWCVATLSPKGSGVPFHFDHSEVLVVQLRGRKRWWIAPNDRVAYPDASYFLGIPDAPRAPAQPAYFPDDLDQPLADTSITTFELAPGSVLFLPRGWWHRTEAIEESVSIILSLGGPTLAQFVIDVLGRVLRDDARWRVPLVGAFGSPAQRAIAAAQLDGVIDHAAALLAELAGADLLSTE